LRSDKGDRVKQLGKKLREERQFTNTPFFTLYLSDTNKIVFYFKI